MPQLRVLLGFTNAPDHSVEETTGHVLAGLYGNAAYPSPPVLQAALQAALTAFTTSIAAMGQGGTAATADRDNKRDALVSLLRTLAGYVQDNCNNDLATLLSSGFEAVSTNHASTPLPKPSIPVITNGMSGQLLIKVGAIINAKSYEMRYALLDANLTPGPWQGAGLFSNSREMALNGLTPGSRYMVQVRAFGSAGYSDWSDPSSHMSM